MTNNETDKAKTGVDGLDDVLSGGLRRNRMYLLEGSPGTGKTTVALQFLLEGVAQGEKVLYITLAESEEELAATAASHGWTLEGIDVFELVPPESLLDETQRQSLLYSSDLELGETTRMIFDRMREVAPSRVVLDSLSEIRLLAQSSLRYRRQVLAIKHQLSQRGTTVLLLDDLTSDTTDKTVHSVAHGVIKLEELAPDYGAQRRRLRIMKYRGQSFRGGFHDYKIVTGGVVTFPRLVAAEHAVGFPRKKVSSGVGTLDALLGGGLEHGTSVLLLGPAGAGKSLLALSYVVSAIAQGSRAALFVFDEDVGLLNARAMQLGIDLPTLVTENRLVLEQVDAAEIAPGEFAHRVRECLEKQGVDVVLIDSLNGYHLAMPEEQHLVLHMHELLAYLNRRGVLTFVTVAQHGLVGDMKSPVDLTYLSDTVILLRFFEAQGRVRRAISVIKKRAGAHENTIREMQITARGVQVGEALEDFQGVLRGVPEYLGTGRTLLGNEH